MTPSKYIEPETVFSQIQLTYVTGCLEQLMLFCSNLNMSRIFKSLVIGLNIAEILFYNSVVNV